MDIKKLDDLARQRIAAKRDEDAAAAKRKQIDKDIADILKPGLGKEYGSTSVKLEDAGIKVGVSFGYTRTFSEDFVKDFDKLPAPLRELASWKPTVSADAWDKLSDSDRIAAAKYVTTKPSSPSLKIEVL